VFALALLLNVCLTEVVARPAGNVYFLRFPDTEWTEIRQEIHRPALTTNAPFGLRTLEAVNTTKSERYVHPRFRFTVRIKSTL
jgi:hypothetical protein